MRRRLFVCSCALAALIAGSGRVAAEEGVDGPIPVAIGVYVTRITEFSQHDGRFDVDLWVWFRWKGDAVAPHETFELVNGVINSRQSNPVEENQGFNYTTSRVHATVFHEFDVRRFPFDDHRLTLEFEDAAADAGMLRLMADEGSALDPAVSVAGWKVAMAAPSVIEHVYPTNYGDRSAGESAWRYSRFLVPITLSRTSIAPLFKLHWVAYLSVGLGLLAFLVRSNDLDARFGLGVGSIFAASASSFILSEHLPDTDAVTFAEAVNFLAVATIFLTVFLSIWSLRLRYADRAADSERLDRRALAAMGVTYVALNIVVAVYYLG